ncbi:hypothetical protein [Streptococcus hyovaginalis]|uniref:hypothetical protein n=1 Tax=Streptococcus hyovaginalis TaxID=149015 RepID=UPI002A7D778C|nr:hypothetical protein [Streptococcus hyovaginalis]MDY3024741.1 hypothetical protein [Streptococcus hyovaginalis]MDY4510545.1 hypothetical protein [Streptococcus hyovaginalis]MDY5974799.1 hypothetical protein [Streptococcus hyovaginalis]
MMRRNEKRGQEQLKRREKYRKSELNKNRISKKSIKNTDIVPEKRTKPKDDESRKKAIYQEWLRIIENKMQDLDFILDRLDAILDCYNQLILTGQYRYFEEAQNLTIDNRLLQLTVGSEFLGDSDCVHWYDPAVVSSKEIDQLYFVMPVFGIPLSEADAARYQRYHQMLGQIDMLNYVLNQLSSVSGRLHPEVLHYHAEVLVKMLDHYNEENGDN